jgi:hypothetical protein
MRVPWVCIGAMAVAAGRNGFILDEFDAGCAGLLEELAGAFRVEVGVALPRCR